MKIWIVEGSTGEYSDHTEWPVCTFKTEELAKEMVELCSAEYRRTKIRREELGLDMWDELPADCVHKYDPRFTEDYTGTLWKCYPVELREAI